MGQPVEQHPSGCVAGDRVAVVAELLDRVQGSRFHDRCLLNKDVQRAELPSHPYLAFREGHFSDLFTIDGF